MFDRVANSLSKITLGIGGVLADGGSFAPAISNDGRMVAFYSSASNLVAGDTNGLNDVFVFDRQTQVMTLVSRGPGGVLGNGGSELGLDISGDGRFVTFQSAASNLVAGDLNGVSDIFVVDLENSNLETRTQLVSKSTAGVIGNSASTKPMINNDGTLWCVWLDLRDKGTKLFASKSVDNGATWSANVLVYRSPGGSICECCHPSIVANKNSVHVLFRNSLKGDRDMYLVSSHDQGLSFGEAVCLSPNHWQLNACPMDGGMLAINNGNQLATVWRRDRSIFHGELNNAETFFGTGEQPWIASNDDGLFTVWTSKRDGDLLLKQPHSTAIEKLSAAASFPVVVATSAPSSIAYVFWEQRVEQASRVMGHRVR